MLDPGDRLWLIGGTTESAALAQAIASLGLPCIVTVTTAAAKKLYPQVPKIQVQVGCLDATQIARFVQQQRIAAILDASHPYAVEISQIAIATATRQRIPYLRFERPAVEANNPTAPVITLENFEALLTDDYLFQQRVLLTVGYKALPLFQPWQERSTLFARILPSVASLEAAITAGFTSDRLIALRPPVTTELEKALWHHWDISLVVTKASGTAGGENIKRVVAAETGIPLIIISRPAVNYPQQTSDFSVALEFCRTHLCFNL